MFGSILSSSIFWKSLRRMGLNPSLNVWLNSPMKPSGSGLLFVGVFLITNSIPLPVVDLFRFSIFSWFNFCRFFFLGIYPCLLGVKFLGVLGSFFFLNVGIHCYKILLELVLLHPISFDAVCLIFICFKILFDFLFQCLHWLFRSILFYLHVFVNFPEVGFMMRMCLNLSYLFWCIFLSLKM